MKMEARLSAMPAKAGIQRHFLGSLSWIPASAGMTNSGSSVIESTHEPSMLASQLPENRFWTRMIKAINKLKTGRKIKIPMLTLGPYNQPLRGIEGIWMCQNTMNLKLQETSLNQGPMYSRLDRSAVVLIGCLGMKDGPHVHGPDEDVSPGSKGPKWRMK